MSHNGIPGRPDSMLIEPDHIISARQSIGETGTPTSMEHLGEREPARAASSQRSMACLAGKLARSGAPPPLVQGLYNEAMLLILSSLEAQRRGHYDLWKDTIVGTQLENLGSVQKPARKPRRKR